MKKVELMILVVAMILLLMAACRPEPAATEVSPAPVLTPAGTAKSAWEEDWERTLAAARKEGTVVIYSEFEAEWRRAFSEAMSKKYGITLQALTVGGSAQLAERVMREQRTGVYFGDVVEGPSGVFLTVYQPEGILAPLEKELVLPEVTDPKLWWRGKLMWLDPDTKTYLNYREFVSPPMAINTDLVKPEELKSYNDLLNPKWKGRIVIQDPTTGGGGQSLTVFLGYGIMSWEYLDRLVKQDPILSRDKRLMVEWVARGKYPMVLGPRKPEVFEFIKAGAPIQYHIPSEGTYLEINGFTSLLKTAPHPNAAKAFLNFYLSREGQTLMAKATGYQSSRVDVPTDFLTPITLRQPGRKYVSGFDRDYRDNEMAMRKRVTEIFMPLTK